MKEQHYSNRIALYFLTATAILILVVFALTFFVVYKTVYRSLDTDLEAEYQEIAHGIVITGNQFVFTNLEEWSENEHAQIEVNPTFLQVSDTSGSIIKKSPNLMGTSLKLLKDENNKLFFNAELSTGQVRQVQMILLNDRNEKAGYVSVAVPLEASLRVLKNLLTILLFGFPFVLLALYFITRYLAQKSIRPVQTLTESAGKISRENLNTRISLPRRNDELYILTETINSLLNRIENTFLLEKQFSSDASHELRTPLSVLKGTLELMIRKPHPADYYVVKTRACLGEVNRMSVLVDQLLLLARYEKEQELPGMVLTSMDDLINRMIARHAEVLEQKKITLDLNVCSHLKVSTNPFMAEQILENIFSNAIKYSVENGTVRIIFDDNGTLIITDEGIGMNQEELSKIFNRFYRVDQSRNFRVKGYGLGLAIAKRFADLLQITIKVESEPQKGTSFTLVFSPSF